jgi:NAD(P)-dependent dehydrogenase (short-subunit alcohol dehydrogenase family)
VEKVALVTGGAQGIGRGIALALSGLGWQVAVADLRRTTDFFFVRTDVSREAAARACVTSPARS